MDRKIRVLIADDEAHIRELLKLIVASLGAEVVGEAQDGVQALSKFAESKPDLVLLDINMPRLAGNHVLKKIREFSPQTLVVMLTAQDSIEAVQECLDLGARNYVLKSNTPERIVELVKESWSDYEAEIRRGMERR
jgi:two-component system chemotaxis response regulator CheY